MKKKSIALILAALAVIMCFALAACGGDKEPTGDETKKTVETNCLKPLDKILNLC